ncbi:MAG: hypothetical protein IPL60_10230 [Ardenticatenia bacterium]|nr:hypothetical protein [Ardenticatenia bacterium]
MNHAFDGYDDLVWSLTAANQRLLQGPLQVWMQTHGLSGFEPFGLQMAWAAEPEPLDEARVLRRTPYQSRQAATDLLRSLADKGLLLPADDGYRLSDAGHAALDEMQAMVLDTLGRRPSFDGAERLAALLRRQVEACLQGGIDAHALAGSRRLDPGDAAPVWARIRRYLGDLASYRDDAHIAAWKPYDVTGPQWEAFSHVWGRKVWGDPVHTAAEAAEKLGFRGFDTAAMQSGLDALVARGWLEADGDTYRLSSRGLQIREAAEEATEQHFFGPWDLSPAEVEELTGLLKAAKATLDA